MIRRPILPEAAKSEGPSRPGPERAQQLAQAVAEIEKQRGRVEHEEGPPTPAPWPPGFAAREGDVLVCSVPEVTLPLPRKYATIKLGGFIYTRRLVAGEDVAEQAATVMGWLEKFSARTGSDRFKRWAAEFRKDGAQRDE